MSEATTAPPSPVAGGVKIMELAAKLGPTVFTFLAFLVYIGARDYWDSQAEREDRASIQQITDSFMTRLERRDTQALSLAESGHAAVQDMAESVDDMREGVSELTQEIAKQNELLRTNR